MNARRRLRRCRALCVHPAPYVLRGTNLNCSITRRPNTNGNQWPGERKGGFGSCNGNKRTSVHGDCQRQSSTEKLWERKRGLPLRLCAELLRDRPHLSRVLVIAACTDAAAGLGAEWTFPAQMMAR